MVRPWKCYFPFPRDSRGHTIYPPSPRYPRYGPGGYWLGYSLSILIISQAATSFVSPLVSSATTGIGMGPPGESGSLPVKISQPSSVIKRVCSVGC